MVEYKEGTFSLDCLKSIISYNPLTGLFTWLISVGSVKAGTTAGVVNGDGYLIIKINYDKYFAHRLAWFYMTGEWPKEEIDHKNGITDDNVWENLREALHIQNSKNRKLNINNTSGFKGVQKVRNKWRSVITSNGTRLNLGYFDTPEEAYAAYVRASSIQHKNFARKEEHL